MNRIALVFAMLINPAWAVEKPGTAASCNQQCFHEIRSALHSSNYKIKAAAIHKLGDMGSARAIRLLIPILDDNGGGHRKGPDTSAPSYNMIAVDSLMRALPDVWAQMVKDSNGKGVIPIPAWKAWWVKNKQNYRG